MNCIVGPHAMLSLIEDVINLTSKPFVVEPNAGYPQNVDGRMILKRLEQEMAAKPKRKRKTEVLCNG